MDYSKLLANLSNNSESALIEYIAEKTKFSFLREESRKYIKNLQVYEKKKDSSKKNETLLNLWPEVLTDALRTLKKNDSREWDPTRAKELETFFHKDSLGIKELKTLLQSFSDFESMMYGASPKHYRDHVTHSFRVWILGQIILNEFWNWNLSAGDPLEEKIRKEEWECMWAIVALCHDVGYPLSHIEKINQKARQTLQGHGLIRI